MELMNTNVSNFCIKYFFILFLAFKINTYLFLILYIQTNKYTKELKREIKSINDFELYYKWLGGVVVMYV